MLNQLKANFMAATSKAFPFLPDPNLIGNLRVRVPVYIETKGFIIKTADSFNEFYQALTLRYQVFYREMQRKKMIWGIDYEDFDKVADLLIIKDASNDRVVGTYRLIASCFSQTFYSASEFDISAFLKEPAVKLELSRACIDRAYRNGRIISLLWRGVVDYMRQTNAKYLFGCSSVWSGDPEEVANVYDYLRSKQYVQNKFAVKALPHYYKPVPKHDIAADASMEPAIPHLMPPILLSYLHAGAQVCENPAFDKAFNCFDLFTILDLDTLDEKYRKKFMQ